MTWTPEVQKAAAQPQPRTAGELTIRGRLPPLVTG
jgi:hypothetical protein